MNILWFSMFRQCVVWYVGVPFWRQALPVSLGHDLGPVSSTFHLCGPFLQNPNWCCHPLTFVSSFQLVAVQQFPTEFRVHFLCFLYEPGGRPAARCVQWTGFSAHSCTVCAVNRLQLTQLHRVCCGPASVHTAAPCVLWTGFSAHNCTVCAVDRLQRTQLHRVCCGPASAHTARPS
jgi:hypothetical protein